MADHVGPPLLNHWGGAKGGGELLAHICALCSKEHHLIVDLSVMLLLFI